MVKSRRSWLVLTFIAASITMVIVSATSCASAKKSIDNLGALMKGRSATVTTYNVFGQKLDRVHGVSVDIDRDGTFDSVDAEGNSNKDSSVLRVSVGKNVMTHVGSTLLMVQDGIIEVTGSLPATVDLNNTDRGVPILNSLYQRFSNAWQGKGRTILVRSQNGSPIAVFAGNQVEYFATDVPKSTLIRIDGKYVLIYRSDYTIYDNALLK